MPPERPRTVPESADELAAGSLRTIPPSPGLPASLPWKPTRRPPVAPLSARDDAGGGGVFRLRPERFVIGRTDGDLRLPHDAMASPRHAEITRRAFAGGGLWVRLPQFVAERTVQFQVGERRSKLVV